MYIAYVFNQKKHRWQLWMDTITKEESSIPQVCYLSG